MKISKAYLTLMTNMLLAVLGLTIAHFTDWVFLIPVLFGIGIPLINIDSYWKEKLVFTFVLSLLSFVVFILTIFTLIYVNFDNYIFYSLIFGFSGLLFLGINGLLIDSITIDLKSSVLTFLLTGLSFPIWFFLNENVFPESLHIVVKQFGMMLFWMLCTTIGVTSGIKN